MSDDDDLGDLFATLESEMEHDELPPDDSGVAGSDGGAGMADDAAGACGGRKRGREAYDETRECAEASPLQRGAASYRRRGLATEDEGG